MNILAVRERDLKRAGENSLYPVLQLGIMTVLSCPTRSLKKFLFQERERMLNQKIDGNHLPLMKMKSQMAKGDR